MSKKIGMICTIVGAALVIAALLLYGYNKYQDSKSGEYAGEVLTQVLDSVQDDVTDEEIQQDVVDAEALDDEMPVVTIDGYDYIGYITIPDIDIELPVMSDWSYPKLRIAACRQFGSSRTDDLVIAAHNYETFFGKLKNLTVGAEVIFTDMDGIVNTYQVEKIETLQPTDVDQVQNSGYDLVLYTCTYGGKTRVTVFLNRVEG